MVELLIAMLSYNKKSRPNVFECIEYLECKCPIINQITDNIKANKDNSNKQAFAASSSSTKPKLTGRAGSGAYSQLIKHQKEKANKGMYDDYFRFFNHGSDDSDLSGDISTSESEKYYSTDSYTGTSSAYSSQSN